MITPGSTTESVEVAQDPPADAPASSSLTTLQHARRWQARYPLVQTAALIVIFLWGASTIDGYDSSASLKSMLVLAALLGLSALPQTLVVLVGGLDLSIPGFISAGGVMTVELSGAHHWSMMAIVIAIVVVCGLLGALNGFLCQRFGANPLIITLGMYAVLQGAILVWTKGNISATPPQSLTNWSSAIGTTLGISIPPVVVLWVLVAIVTGLVLARTVPGRRLYATGTNVRAARLALLRTGRIWTAVFAISGVLSGLTGIFLAGYSSGASPAMGDPYLFQGLAAVIVGGTALGSAHGDYWRTVLGALILTALTTILVGKGFDSADTQMLFGFIILIVVAGYGRSQRLRDRV
ncbi:MAG: ABC transporter permease [Solirubrobacteraceae bacterium]